jgi:hypothetical protein
MIGRARGGPALCAAALTATACGRPAGSEPDGGTGAGVVTAPSTTIPGAPRAGMVWVGSGALRAGSAVDEAPRVADAELPGTEVPMGGFYLDVLPWPNEAGAIPTTNVTREEAQRLCGTRGKRLCTELEWERACKGPDNWRYEYGPSYDPRVCGAGIAAETAARRPSGERPSCRSPFGARDMHGGPWEWTDSSWGRGSGKDRAVARGGGDASGELTSRCAHALMVTSDDRSPVVGFRCCAGPRNDAQVQLAVTTGPFLERTAHPSGSPSLEALGSVSCGPPVTPAPCSVGRAWTWRPAPNVELSVAGGCAGRAPEVHCALAVSRALRERIDVIAEIDTGWAIPDVVFADPAERRLRVRGGDAHGSFFRDVVFTYGRVEVRPVH